MQMCVETCKEWVFDSSLLGIAQKLTSPILVMTEQHLLWLSPDCDQDFAMLDGAKGGSGCADREDRRDTIFTRRKRIEPRHAADEENVVAFHGHGDVRRAGEVIGRAGCED